MQTAALEERFLVQRHAREGPIFRTWEGCQFHAFVQATVAVEISRLRFVSVTASL
jgi:hypothetical protein